MIIIIGTTVSNPLLLIAEDTVDFDYDLCQNLEIVDMVTCYAKKYGVDQKLAHYVVRNESQYNSKAIGDMSITCRYGVNKGLPVRARGLVQITDCYYPSITDEQAFDPVFNLKFGMELMADKKSCISQFTTCRRYYR